MQPQKHDAGIGKYITLLWRQLAYIQGHDSWLLLSGVVWWALSYLYKHCHCQQIHHYIHRCSYLKYFYTWSCHCSCTETLHIHSHLHTHGDMDQHITNHALICTALDCYTKIIIIIKKLYGLAFRGCQESPFQFFEMTPTHDQHQMRLLNGRRGWIRFTHQRPKAEIPLATSLFSSFQATNRWFTVDRHSTGKTIPLPSRTWTWYLRFESFLKKGLRPTHCDCLSHR